MEEKTFGKYLRKLRLDKEYGLRQFAEMVGIRPSNFSNIERGKIPPPQDYEKLKEISDVLEIKENSKEWKMLFDLAVSHKAAALPADVKDFAGKTEGIPLLLRTVKNKRLSKKKFIELANFINKNL